MHFGATPKGHVSMLPADVVLNVCIARGRAAGEVDPGTDSSQLSILGIEGSQLIALSCRQMRRISIRP